MRKIAIRLGVLVFTMVLGVLVFIWYRSAQPPALLGLVPQDIKAGGFIDTRNVVKKAFAYGANEFTDISYPELFMGIFALAQNPQEPGINVYSEIVWFEHKEGFQCLFARLSSPEKWEEFLKKHQAEAGLSNMEKTDDISYVFLQEQNAVLAWRGKHLALLFDKKEGEKLSVSQITQVLKPNTYNQSLSEAYKKIAPDVFFVNIEENTTFSLKVLSGKVRYEWNEFNAPIKEFEPFYAVKAPEGTFSDTSVLVMNARFLHLQKGLIGQFEELNVLSSLNLAGSSIGAGLYYYKPNDSAKANIRVQPFLNGLEFPAEYKIENPSEVLLLADIAEGTMSEVSFIQELYLPVCKRFLMIQEENSTRRRIAGTCYFAEKEKLPLKEVAEFLLKKELFKS